MTRLILSPFDPAAPGSHQHRMQVVALLAEMETARQDDDLAGLVRITQRLTELITPRLRTDDGTPVDDALARVSADEFDVLTSGILARAVADNVPLASTPT